MASTSTPDCKAIHGGETVHGKQGLDYFSGISAESAGAQGICMHLETIPPGGRANAHFHRDHETAIYFLSGEATMWYGEGLTRQLTAKAGDYLYIPAGMTHLPANLRETEPCIGVLARTDPSEQEGVELRPDLDGIRLR